MHSLRKWFYRPKKEDSSKLAHFYWADEELTMVATELDSFDGRTDPDRCSILVSQLRICQDKVLSICNEIMEDAIPDMRANRDFRAKFPDDVLHENLAGQLWFGAECLAAGSNIMNRELESAGMRPLAKALTRALDNVRCLLREQSLKNSVIYSDKVKESLRIFDRLFAEFELCYVSAMVPIKSAKEYHLQQEIIVLFSETLIRALKMGLVTQDVIDDYDPSLMFTIPRLAIVWGLLLFPEGPLNVDRDSGDMSELFRPFCSLLFKIRDLLWTLTRVELQMLEKMLCSQEEPQMDEKDEQYDDIPIHTSEDYINKFYLNNSNCKQFIQDFYAYNFGIIVGEDVNQDVTNSAKQSSDSIADNKVDSDVKGGEIEVKLQDHSEQSNAKQIKISKSRNYTQPCSETSPSHIDCSTPLANNDIGRHGLTNLNSHCDASQNSGGCKGIRNNDSDEAFSDEPRTEASTLRSQGSHLPFRDSQCYTSCDNSSEICSYCADDVDEPNLPSSVQEALCFERSLRTLHDQCTCSNDSPSSEHLTPSRELLRQVMRHVEIVPPGQHITGYSSSPESSPRAYHHGLLSHSFPTHTACNTSLPIRTPQHVTTSKWCRRRQKPSRHRTFRNSSVRFNCDISSSRHYYNCYSPVSNPACFPLFRNSETPSSTPLTIPQVQNLRDSAAAAGSDHTYSSCSSCQSISSVSSPEWESTSPDTSSYNSECQDDEEIALALQAAEIASRNKARSRFKSSSDLLHKLFVCISGVADQLQTNYASDLRNILKSVFDINCSQTQSNDLESSLLNDDFRELQGSDFGQESLMRIQDLAPCDSIASHTENQGVLSVEVTTESPSSFEQQDEDERDHSSVDSAEEAVPDGSPTPSLVISDVRQNSENFINEDPPAWLPDELSSHCMACKVPFTILRRRHHCRNCGKIFCSRCSSNSIPLPRFGHLKPVRVCNQCFMYQLTSLVMQQQL